MIDDKVIVGTLGTVVTFTTGEAFHLAVSCLAGLLTCVYMTVSIYRKVKNKEQ